MTKYRCTATCLAKNAIIAEMVVHDKGCLFLKQSRMKCFLFRGSSAVLINSAPARGVETTLIAYAPVSEQLYTTYAALHFCPMLRFNVIVTCYH